MAIELVDLEREIEFRLNFNQKTGLDVSLSPCCILELDYSLSVRDSLLLNGIKNVNPFLNFEAIKYENLGRVSMAAHLLSFNITMSGCGEVLSAMNALGLEPLGGFELIHYNPYWNHLENDAAVIALRTVLRMAGWNTDPFQVPCLCEDSLDVVSFNFEKSRRCQYLVTMYSSAFFTNPLGH